MGTESKIDDKNSPEYLAQLLKDKKQIQAFPNVFVHLERLLDEEVNKVRVNLFHLNQNKQPMELPEPSGQVVQLSEKLFVPSREHPDFNFVGRILGPRGMTAKQLEQDTGCKIMVRGKGSMRDKKKEEANRGKPNWEHLSEELHVLITVEDTRNRSELKMKRAIEEVNKLLVPAAEGEDDLKKRQLMELAIINGTYRDTKAGSSAAAQAATAAAAQPAQAAAQMPRVMGPPLTMPPQLRSPTPTGAPIILAPRMQLATSMAQQAMLGGQMMPPLMSPTDPTAGLTGGSLMYPMTDPSYALPQPALFDASSYAAAMDQSSVADAKLTSLAVRSH